MAGHVREFVLTIAGQQYRMVLDVDAMVRLEEMFSTPDREVTFQDVFKRVEQNSMRHARGFFWAMLQRHHPDVTLSKASALMGEAIAEFGPALAQAGMMATPDPDDLRELGMDRPSRPRKARSAKAGTGAH